MTEPKRMSMPAQIFFGGIGGLFVASALAWSAAALNFGLRQVLDGLPVLAVVCAFILMAITAVRCWWVRSYFPIVLCVLYIAGMGFVFMLFNYSGRTDDALLLRLFSIVPWAFFGICLTSAFLSFTGAEQPSAAD
ncbi:conserved membrane hypothetical protein [Paraburkholderia tropica]|uniref:hypothetical protein n=1 Tax=Paraburkholderia tropica TaxID=92647 RepID=UPI001CAE7B51|nr:hypothetical protein [Paraburkholderia tropica]CAG9235600.1 conserved membrane hypothetical protein [Paraburkholderia tropica]